MIPFRHFLNEKATPKPTRFTDEHAVANVFNHFSKPEHRHMLDHPEKMKDHLEAARKDPSHPLHPSNHAHDESDHDRIHQEHRDATHVIHALHQHPELKKAFHDGSKAKVTGAARGELSDTFKKHGATDKTSKADLEISNGHKTHRVSLKKGDSQLMSAQPEEFAAIYDHATTRMMHHDKNFTQAHKDAIMHKIHALKHSMNDMKTTNQYQDKSRNPSGEVNKKISKLSRIVGQATLNKIHADHPNLIHHVAHEASTGEGKFGGHDTGGTARYLVTGRGEKTAHVHDTKTDGHIVPHGTVPRLALPKDGKGKRVGNVKLDKKAKGD